MAAQFFSLFQQRYLPTTFTCLLLGASTLCAGGDSYVCPRFAEGALVQNPSYLVSQNGILNAILTYATSPDMTIKGNDLFCYLTDSLEQSPVFRVTPGDHLQINFKNALPKDLSNSSMIMNSGNNVCGSSIMDQSSTNIHFHGTHTSPTCHQDGAIYTLVNAGNLFSYDLFFPSNHLPGLYAYHPHVHGLAEKAVLGGASGAIVVSGIENFQPAVAGLPERILIIRDNLRGANTTDVSAPEADISLNYIPINYPNYTTPIITIKPGEIQFWRVLNAAADTILDIQVIYDGVPQPLQIVAKDGIPLDNFMTDTRYNIPLGQMARVEFIVQAPTLSVQNASLITQKFDTGADGDSDPYRPIATIKADPNADTPKTRIPYPSSKFLRALNQAENLVQQKPFTTRNIYFSQSPSDPNDADSQTNFYITVQGQNETLFDVNNAPAIETFEGVVEDWIIENRAQEAHVFHIHQLHFVQLEQNGTPINPKSQTLIDTIIIPAWSGYGPYPNAKIRLDFRNPLTVGKFVYHCHILEHEDNGMMASIVVHPTTSSSAHDRKSPGILAPIFLGISWFLSWFNSR